MFLAGLFISGTFLGSFGIKKIYFGKDLVPKYKIDSEIFIFKKCHNDLIFFFTLNCRIFR